MPDSGASSIPGLVLSEARELRSKQDARLRALRALARSTLAGFLSAALRHDDDRIRNEALLVRAKRFIALQVCGTFGGGAMLLALLLDVI